MLPNVLAPLVNRRYWNAEEIRIEEIPAAHNSYIVGNANARPLPEWLALLPAPKGR